MSILSRTLRTDSTSAAPLVLRVGLGSVFFAHGAQKLFGWWGGPGLEGTAKFFGSLGLTPPNVHAVLAGGGEFFGGILLVLGLLTRFAAAQAAVIMGVAIWTVHRTAFFAPEGMEYALVLLLVAVALVLTGGGALSVDAHLAASKPAAAKPRK